MKVPQFTVRVSCMTFNHAAYIEDTMDGFCMQETSFPYLCNIIDDKSTDGEQEVIKKYLADHFDLDDKGVFRQEETDDYYLTFAQHKSNKNCFFAVIYLKYNHYSIRKPKKPYVEEWDGCTKYLATCEGDDFWVNPRKLQMQYDYMESHPSCSLCHGDVVYYNDDKGCSEGRVGLLINRLVNKSYSKEETFKRIVKSQYSAISLTCFYRKELLEKINKNTVKLMMGDTPLLLDMSQQGDFKYFPEVMGVYRIHSGSTVHKTPAENRRFSLGVKEMFVYYCHKYNYKIPFLVKYRYNTSYMSVMVNDGEVKPPALYKIFPLLYYSNKLSNNRAYNLLLKRVLYPMQKKLDSLADIMRTRYRKWSNRNLPDYYYDPKTKTIKPVKPATSKA